MFKRLLGFPKIKFQNYSLKKRFSSKITTDSFMNGSSSLYVEQMFKLWKEDKKSVHSSWDSYFTNIENGVDPALAYQAPPNLVGCKYH